MNVYVSPSKLGKGVRDLRALGADRSSKRRLAWAVFRHNLWRTHAGWDKVIGRVDACDRVSPRIAEFGGRPCQFRPRSSDVFVLRDVLLHRVYDFSELRALRPTTVVDLGANIGVTALWWRSLFPDASILCVEPETDNLELLNANAIATGGRCDVLAAAVAAEDGPLTLNMYGESWSHSSVKRPDRASNGSRQVRGIRLSTLLRDHGLTRLDLLKVDIEGAEVDVLPQLATLSVPVGAMIVEIHPPYSRERLEQDCSAAGMAIVPISGMAANMAFAVSTRTTAR